MIEIRWHGRGGQGAKTAALLLADAAFETGLHVQGFPEYGPERMGAPITAFNRLSETTIRVHSFIYDPDIVVVVDETLLKSVDVMAGIKQNGKILVNTKREHSEIAESFNGFECEIWAIDAVDISKRNLGKALPNTPLLSAVTRLTGIIEKERFFADMQSAFAAKFKTKPEVIEGNMNALKDAWVGAVRVA